MTQPNGVLKGRVLGAVPRINVEGRRGSRLRAMGFGVRASVGRVAANGSRFPPRDPVREAGARADRARPTPSCASPPSAALHPRVAARSAMSGASWVATHANMARPQEVAGWSPRSCGAVQRTATRRTLKRRAVGHRRACAALFASFAAGVAPAGATATGRGSRRSVQFARLALD
jgi:hypothetical protein